MNHKLVYICLLLFFFISLQTFPQSEQIKNKLQQEGISTKADVLEALRKRNMTEDDARRLAKQYGMDYDTFIATYITGSSVLTEPPVTSNTDQDTTKSVTNVMIQPVILDSKPEQEIQVDRTPVPGENGLEYFGYNIFKNIPSSFEPSEIGPIDPGYLIGPGDVLRLSVWGAVELQYQLTVDQQGNIFIPTAGQFFVSGTSYESLQQKMTAYLSKFYEGLASDPPTIFLDISLAKLKPIKIFVMGEINQPGGYNISSFATVFNALYAVGGPRTTGSLREIRVVRNNKVIASVDIYDYLLKGELIGDVRLQNNDMIFIPPRKKTVSISGEVLRPAIYELKENENLSKLLEFAGGLNATAYTGRAQINRIVPFEKRDKNFLDKEFIDVDLSSVIKKQSDVDLYDKDAITIFTILDKVENYVTISGSVYRPGTFELSTVSSISELIERAEGVLPETYFGKADIIRTRPDESFEFISIDLAKALEGDSENNITLEPRDEVKIYSVYELVDKKFVSISGFVKQPVTLPYADSLTLYDMVFRAGGLQDPFFRGRAFIVRGDLIRVNPDGVSTRIIPFDLEKLLKDQSFNMQLMPGDKIYIYSANVEKELDKFVTIEGEVRKPGLFPLSTNMTVTDLILQAGGFTEKSLRTTAYVNRIRPGGFEGDKLSETHIITLQPGFVKDMSDNKIETGENDFVLQHKDVVVIRKNPDYESQRRVTISGEVKYPGVYVLETRNQTVLDLIKMSGGPTSEAFLYGAVFNRGGTRLNVNLEELFESEDADDNVLLRDGDNITIPFKPNTVLLTGEVNNPGLFKFVPGESVKDYIDKAGGETDSANYIIHTKANGEADKVGFGWFTSNPDVYDGSKIHVTKLPPPPPEGLPVDVGGTIKDVLAIVVSAVTIIVLANQLK
ncbi:MAG: SLBB domain-containing protein [Ignavibacteriales bacterium]|nr:MAG: SLBB domain-containing protein [Ignavibacteriales bacterium]